MGDSFPPPTERLYLRDDPCFEADAVIAAVREDSLALDRTCFYPGGGGQPPDEGSVRLRGGQVLEISSVHADPQGVLWHLCRPAPPPGMAGEPARLILNRQRRWALMRHHTALHVLNSIALRDYGGWITGVQIGADQSRIDFKVEGFSAAACADLEEKVNAVLGAGHAVKSYFLPEEEFERRADLLRTLQARPPVSGGRVRVVEIEGFDAQACGGTHVRATSQVGGFSIFRTENKGKLNKRLYVRLAPPETAALPGG